MRQSTKKAVCFIAAASLFVIYLLILHALQRFDLHWYRGLNKPSYCLQKWGISAVYIAVSAALFLLPLLCMESRYVLLFSLFHIALCGLTVLFFFTLKCLWASLISLLLSWTAGVADLRRLFSYRLAAGVVFVLFIVGISYLISLNYSIFMLN